MYTWNSVYLLKHPERDMPPLTASIFIAVYLLVYYVWDTSNSQKNNFRSVLNGSYKPRPWYACMHVCVCVCVHACNGSYKPRPWYACLGASA